MPPRPLAAWALAWVALLVLAAPARAQSFALAVNDAIDRGARHLLASQNENGSFTDAGDISVGDPAYPMGYTALVTYTLLKSGVPADDPIIQRAVEYLRYLPLKKTYSVGCLILALDALHDPTIDPWIQAAAAWLEENLDSGAKLWGYPGGGPELSNTQYAALGLWAAGKHGHPGSEALWREVIAGTLRRQNEDGGFFYRSGHWPFSTGSMTCGGIATLSVAIDALEQMRTAAPAVREARAAIQRGLAWLDERFTVHGNPSRESGIVRERFGGKGYTGSYHHYYLYGIERTAAFTDRQSFGGVDWYRAGAELLLHQQAEDGGWGMTENTCFALLFLRRATLSGLRGGAQPTGVKRWLTWRYTSARPTGDWTQREFDDSDWLSGPAGFGSPDATGLALRTPWKSADLWLRRRFHFDPQLDADPGLWALHDDSAEFYVNGVLAVSGASYTLGKFARYDFSEAAREALREGENLLAVHVCNTGGAQSLDVRLRDPGEPQPAAAQPWWKVEPAPDTVFVRRWLVAGPISDPEQLLFHASPLPDEEAAPRAGEKARGATWREVRTPGGQLDFEAHTKARDNALYYAFTWLHVERETDLVLWVGSDDGLRLFVDGRPVYSLLDQRSLVADEHRVYLRLRPGAHRLLAKLGRYGGPARMTLRLGDAAGGPQPDVRPALSEERPDWGAVAQAHPELYTWQELFELLPTQTKTRLDFAKAADFEKLAIGPVRDRFPAWLDKVRPAAGGHQPAPGGRGMLGLWSPARSLPVRLIYKIAIPPKRSRLSFELAPEAFINPGKSGVRLRLGIWKDELSWLAEQTLTSGERPSKSDWQQLAADIEPWAGETVLVVLEAQAAQGHSEPALVFLDELEIE